MPVLGSTRRVPQPDEDFINKSLPPSVDTQADGEPLDDSDDDNVTDKSARRFVALPPQRLLSAFDQPHYPTLASLSKIPEYPDDIDAPCHNPELNATYRSSITSHNRLGQQARQPALNPEALPFGDTPSIFPGLDDLSPGQTSSPDPAYMQPFDRRSSYGLNQPIGSQSPFLPIQFPPLSMHNPDRPAPQQQQPRGGFPSSHLHSYSAQGAHLISQAPYEPQVPTMTNASNSALPPGPSNFWDMNTPYGSSTAANGREIWTSAVGLPGDMQEDDFWNTFAPSQDGEAATLETHIKEHTAHDTPARPNTNSMLGSNSLQLPGQNNRYRSNVRPKSLTFSDISPWASPLTASTTESALATSRIAGENGIVAPWDQAINELDSVPLNAPGSNRSSFGLGMYAQQPSLYPQQWQSRIVPSVQPAQTLIGYVSARSGQGQIQSAASGFAGQRFPRGRAAPNVPLNETSGQQAPIGTGRPAASQRSHDAITTAASPTGAPRSGSSAAGSARGGNTSPQVAFFGSAKRITGATGGTKGIGARSGVPRTTGEQNPPTDTLYVGNLPTSPPPIKYPSDLEATLREVFSVRPGYRKLCYRHKANGPMCFVEFENVEYAARALQEMSGHTLHGAVKNGIGLSYSKNSLDMRTPPSPGANQGGQKLQQQEDEQGSWGRRLAPERPLLRRTELRECLTFSQPGNEGRDDGPVLFEEHISPEILKQDTLVPPSLASDCQPAIAVCWVSASRAFRHARQNMLQIANLFSDYGLLESEYCVMAGFDEMLILRGIGFLEQVHILVSSKGVDQPSDSFMIELGKILSPYSGIVYTDTTSYYVPIFDESGASLDLEDIVRHTASKFGDRGATCQAPPIAMVLSATDSTDDISSGIFGGCDGDKGGKKAPEKGKRKSDGPGDDPDKPEDDNKGSGGDPEGQPDGPGNTPSEALAISFQVESNLISEIGSAGSNVLQRLTVDGKLLVKNTPFQSKGRLEFAASHFEFTKLTSGRVPEATITPYKQFYTRVLMNGNQENADITVHKPHRTRKWAKDIVETSASQKAYAVGGRGGLGNGTLVGDVLSVGGFRAGESSESSEKTKYGSRIEQQTWNGISNWGFHVDDPYEQEGGLNLSPSDLPSATFHFLGETAVPAPPPDSAGIEVSSYWSMLPQPVSQRSRWLSKFLPARSQEITYSNLCQIIGLSIPSNLNEASDYRATTHTDPNRPKQHHEVRIRRHVGPVQVNAAINEADIEISCQGIATDGAWIRRVKELQTHIFVPPEAPKKNSSNEN